MFVESISCCYQRIKSSRMFLVLLDIFKFLLLALLEFVYKCKKIILFLWTRKHEFERICEFKDDDIYEKCVEIDNWLAKSSNHAIRLYMDNILHRKAISIVEQVYQNILRGKGPRNNSKKLKNARNNILLNDIEYRDTQISLKHKEMTDDLFRLILRSKRSTISTTGKECLCDILYRIVGYRLTLIMAEKLASTKYEGTFHNHSDKLMNFWNNLVIVDQNQQSKIVNQGDSNNELFPTKFSKYIRHRDDIVSSRWSHIGFQGEDPGTDFRGMGLLGLIQLEYLSQKPNDLARNLLRSSLDEKYNYPFAIVGINITYNLLKLYRDGTMKHLYFDTEDTSFRNRQPFLKLSRLLNDLYVELYLRFDCFWRVSKPKNIFEFKSLMEKFIQIVRTDMSNRNFSLKFIY